MASTPRELPRFLPVLTEVVELPQAIAIPAAEVAEAAASAPEDAGSASQQAQPVPQAPLSGLSEEAQALIGQLVDAQIQVLRTQMLHEIESAVRQALTKVIAPASPRRRSRADRK